MGLAEMVAACVAVVVSCQPLPDRSFGPPWEGPTPIRPPSWTNQAPEGAEGGEKNIEHRTSNIEHRSSDVGSRTSDFGPRTLGKVAP